MLRPSRGAALDRSWQAHALRLLLRLQQKADYALAPDIQAVEAKLVGAPFTVTLRLVAVAESAATLDATRGELAQFQQGYATTSSVQLNIGSVHSGAAAGNYYGMVPVTVRAATTGGGTQTFVGCYTVHLGEPANQAVPPFQPMAIQAAHIQQVPNAANTGVLMNVVCDDR